MLRWLRWDPALIVVYGLLVGIGLLTLYSISHAEVARVPSLLWQKQLMWAAVAVFIGLFLWAARKLDLGIWAYPLYGLGMVLLVFTLLMGGEVAGAQAWLRMGGFNLQPSELMKVFTALALAHYLTTPGFERRWNRALSVGALLIIGLPVALIFAQNDMGTALMFGGLVLMLLRRGMPPAFITIPMLIGMVFLLSIYFPAGSVMWAWTGLFLLVGWIMWRVAKWRGVGRALLVWGAGMLIIWSSGSVFERLKPHQQQRILVTIGKVSDPRGQGYNLQQSLIAIGSGGLSGKGYRNGSQTQYGFVPAQHTDFIFTAIAEEWGWMGAMSVLLLYAALLLRVLRLAERSHSEMVNLFGYGFVGVTGLHVLINLASVMGLFPVVGVPLPYISYGGSALAAFSLFLFMFLAMEASAREAVL